MTNPPPTGVAWECALRSTGKSIMRTRGARLRRTPVNNNDARKSPANNASVDIEQHSVCRCEAGYYSGFNSFSVEKTGTFTT